MDALTPIVVWLNAAANALGRFFLAPIGMLPGWLSATIVSAVTGLLLLFAFKYTSNQRAIRKVRSDIKANLLALKLFKESPAVTLRAQGRLFLGAFWLLAYAVVPMLVMLVPVLLIIGQLSLWYQSQPLQMKAQPLKGKDEAVVTVKLGGHAESPWPEVRLQPTTAVEVMQGPVQVQSKREICWNIKAREPGYHRLSFQVNGLSVEKELAIGDGFMRVSTKKPGWSWSDALLHPWEEPLSARSPVQSVEIEYPKRASWTSGTDSWIVYWFVVSTIAALFFRRLLGVSI